MELVCHVIVLGVTGMDKNTFGDAVENTKIGSRVTVYETFGN